MGDFRVVCEVKNVCDQSRLSSDKDNQNVGRRQFYVASES